MNTISYFLNLSRFSFSNTGIQIRKQKEKKKDEKNLQNLSTNEYHLMCSPSVPTSLNFHLLLEGLSWAQCPGLPRPRSQPARALLFPNCISGKLQTHYVSRGNCTGNFPLKDARDGENLINRKRRIWID